MKDKGISYRFQVRRHTAKSLLFLFVTALFFIINITNVYAEWTLCFSIGKDKINKTIQRVIVRSVQEALIERGFSPGIADGRLGQKTKKAIVKFQNSVGLSPSGKLSDEVFAELKIDREKITQLPFNEHSITKDFSIVFDKVCFNFAFQSNRKGSMVPMDERYFKAYESKFNLHFSIMGKLTECRPMFQDVAYVIGDFHNKSQLMAILSYNNCAIPVPDQLSVTKLRLRANMTIKISHAVNGLLYPAKDSKTGLLMGLSVSDEGGDGNKENFTLAPNYANNIIWYFEKPEIVFRTEENQYRSTKKGATIKFKDNKIHLDGVEKTPLVKDPKINISSLSALKPSQLPATGKKDLPAYNIIPGIFLSLSNSPLKIVTRSGKEHYFIKFLDWVTGNISQTMFIRGGESLSTDIPAGTYEIKYATGFRWYDEKELFGKETICAAVKEPFHFSPNNGFSIELIPRVGGNLSTLEIKKNEW